MMKLAHVTIIISVMLAVFTQVNNKKILEDAKLKSTKDKQDKIESLKTIIKDVKNLKGKVKERKNIKIMNSLLYENSVFLIMFCLLFILLIFMLVLIFKFSKGKLSKESLENMDLLGNISFLNISNIEEQKQYQAYKSILQDENKFIIEKNKNEISNFISTEEKSELEPFWECLF